MRHHAALTAVFLAALAPLVSAPSCEELPPLECPEGFEEDDLGNCLELPPESTLEVLVGSLRIDSEEAMDEFCASYNAITGDLTVDVPHLVDTSGLSCLRRVGASLHLVDMEALESVELPLLDQVGADLYVQGNPVLTSLQLPALRRVERALVIQYLPSLDEVVLPELTRVGHFLSVYRTGALRVHLPLLTTIGDPHWLTPTGEYIADYASSVFYIRVNTELEELSAPLLETVSGVVKISSNTMLQQVDLPLLRRIGGGLYLSFGEHLPSFELPMLESLEGFLYLQRSPVTRFSLPQLRRIIADFYVQYNESLSLLELPELSLVGGAFFITNNPSLPASEIDALLESIGESNIAGPINIHANGPN